MNRMTPIAALGAAAVLAGCATVSTVTEFDRDGNVVKVIVTERDPFDKVTDSTRDKSVIAWSNGWAAYIRAAAATVEHPTPCGEIYAGKVARGLLLLHKDQRNVDRVAAVIAATREDVEFDSGGLRTRGGAAE